MTDRPELDELLGADRDLSAAEMEQLAAVADHSWASLQLFLHQRVRATYQVATEKEFTECVREHLEQTDIDELVEAGTFHCRCGRLLKDRNAPVATSVLLERDRIRQLWFEVEQAQGNEEYKIRFERFRRAIGAN